MLSINKKYLLITLLFFSFTIQVEAALWTPEYMSTGAWYDATDASTITESGGSVTQWDDKSGNGYHATVPPGMPGGNVPISPITGTENINGLNALSFNGNVPYSPTVSHTLLWSDAGAELAGNGTSFDAFTVIKPKATNLNMAWMTASQQPTMSPNPIQQLYFLSGGTYGSFRRNDSSVGSTVQGGTTNTNAQLNSASFNGTNMEYFVNGTSIFSLDNNRNPLTIDRFIIGGRCTSGQTQRTWYGLIGELVVIPSNLILAERQKLEGYLAWKWGLESNLPGGHPYEGAAPTITILTLDSDGGSAVDPIIGDFGTTVTPPANPTRTNYTFTGWSPALPETMPATDATHTAQWTINQYTLTFDTDGGSAVSPITDDYDAVVTPPADPTKEGYTFAGWNPALPSNIPAGDQTYTAVWTIGQYALTFNTDGGTPVDPIIDDFGALITPPVDPTKEGYIFAGWSPSLPATMPGSNTTYTALWDAPNTKRKTTSIEGRIKNLTEIGNTQRAVELSMQYNKSVTSIESLKVLLLELQQKLAALLSNTPASNNNPITRDLELNDEGDDVRTLQTLLISKGYSIPQGATGFFGPQTRAALIKFQQDNNISPAVGYYGPLTRAKMSN